MNNMNLQKLLAENMLRFGSKNLDSNAKRKLKRLAEQGETQRVAPFSNYPYMLSKIALPTGQTMIPITTMPVDDALVFVTPQWKAGVVQSTVKIDNSTIYGLIGAKFITKLGVDMRVGNLIIGNAVTTGVALENPTDSGVLYALVADAKAYVPFGATDPASESYNLNQALQQAPSNITAYEPLKVTSYVEAAQQLHSICTNGAKVELSKETRLYNIIKFVDVLVAAGKIPKKTADIESKNPYAILTMKPSAPAPAATVQP
jgi:hypothetical protein